MDKSSSIDSIKTQNSPRLSVTASKKDRRLIFFCTFQIQQFKTYEVLWRLVFLVISVFSLFLFNKIYVYQTNEAFDKTRKGQFINLIIFGIPIAIIYTAIDSLVHYCFDDLCEKYFINQKTYSNPEARRKRCYTLVKWGFSIFYYSLVSFFGFVLLQNTTYFPTWLGGTGSPMNIYNDFPKNSQFSLQIEIFYLIQFGKHFSRTFGHFFIRPEGNYYEYGLHHALSIFLILFSYTMDHWLIGTFVLLIHDFTDLTLIFARAYKDYKHRSEIVLQAFYAIAFSTWVFCRIFIFSYAFIYSLCYGIFNVLEPKMLSSLDPIFRQTMYLPALFMAGMLIILQGLQLFWTYYIVRSVISVNISAKIVTHNYD